MALEVEVLGEIEDLAIAVGLVNESASGNTFNEDWLANPSDSLTSILSDDTQREALERFVIEVLDTADVGSLDVGGVSVGNWLPLFTSDDPSLTLAMVIDDAPTDHVRVGVGASVSSTDPEASLEISVPLFRIAKAGQSPAGGLLLLGPQPAGAEAAVIEATGHIRVDTGAPTPGQAFLGGLGVRLSLPTDGSQPSVSLTVDDLQLPGEATPRDYVLSISEPTTLDDQLLELLLGLIDAQAIDTTVPSLRDLATLLGLGSIDDLIGPFPVADLAEGGAEAVIEWLGELFSEATSRTRWFEALADLLGDTFDGTGDGISVTFGSVEITATVVASTGAVGQTLLTPRVTVAASPGTGVEVSASADLFTVDTSDGGVEALPSLQIGAEFTPDLAPASDPDVESICVGLELNDQRQPALLLLAKDVTINGRNYPELDLSSPQQAIDTATTLITDLAATLIPRLGTAGATIAKLLGVDPPPGVDPIDVSRFLQSPLDAIREWWAGLLAESRDEAEALFGELRQLIADQSTDGGGAPSAAVTGSGTEDDPWRFAIIGAVDLCAWTHDPDPTTDVDRQVSVGLCAEYTLNATSTVDVSSELRATIVTISLDEPSATFVGQVDGKVALSGPSGGPLVISLGGGDQLTATDVELAATWSPATGLEMHPGDPTVTIEVDGETFTLGDLANLDIDDVAAIAIERLLQLLAQRQLPGWLADLTRTFGWDGGLRGLRLDDLVSDGDAALRAWLRTVFDSAGIADTDGPLAALRSMLARLLRGVDDPSAVIEGTGAYDDPWRIALTATGPAVSAAMWVLPADADVDDAATVDGIGLGLWLPIDDEASAPLAITGSARIAIAEVALDGSGALGLTVAPRVLAEAELTGRSGDLVPAGSSPVNAGDRVGSVAATIDLALTPGAAPANASIELRDVVVFGTAQPALIVSTSTGALTPEVEQLLSMLSTRLESLRSNARVAALVGALEVLNLIDETVGGFVFDAVNHLVLDTRAFFADALADVASVDRLLSELVRLVNSPAIVVTSDGKVQVTAETAGRIALVAMIDPLAGTIGIDIDLTGGVGPDPLPVSGTATLVTSTAGTATGSFEFGSTTGPLGGLALAGSTADGEMTAAWTLPSGERVVARLYPTLAVAGIEDLLRDLSSAAVLHLIVGELRDQPAVATIIDGLLDAIGLLRPDGGAGQTLRSPLSLLRDPVGWLTSTEVFGTLESAVTQVEDLIESFKPLTGLTGTRGELVLAGGFALMVSADTGGVSIALDADTSAFVAIDTDIGRLAALANLSMTLQTGASPRIGATLRAALNDLPSGASVEVGIDPSIAVTLRPTSTTTVMLFPNPPGIAELLGAAAGLAIVEVLDAIAELAPAGLDPAATLQEQVGRLILTLGQALGLTDTASSRAFSATALNAWIANPADALIDALADAPDLSAEALANALDDLLDPVVGVSFTSDGSGARALMVTSPAAGFMATLQIDTAELTVKASRSDLEVIGRFEAEATLALGTGGSGGPTGAGLRDFSVEVGPATIPIGATELYPFACVRRLASTTFVEGGLYTTGVDTPGDVTDDNGLLAQWRFDSIAPTAFDLLAFAEDPKVAANTDGSPTSITIEALSLLIDLIFGYALETDAIQDLLSKGFGSSDIASLLDGVVIETSGSGLVVVDDVLGLDSLLDRAVELLSNAADAVPDLNFDGLQVSLTKTGSVLGVALDVPNRVDLPLGELTLSIESDASWINRPDGVALTPGLQLNLIDTAAIGTGTIGTGTVDLAALFAPGLSVNGVGVRLARSSGKLIDGPVSLDSVALHAFCLIDDDEVSGGAQFALKNLAVDLAGSSSNGVAAGILSDAQSGDEPVRPAFSPAFAVQKHGANPTMVSLTAGDPPGPWWLAIQRNFGPVYIEQVGLAVAVAEDDLEAISVFIDGQISLFGLTAAVDDFQITYFIDSGSLFDLDSWRVDLAGLAISADLSGLQLAGGLRKFENGATIEYVGMLMGRFSTYGLSVFGGYSAGPDFASFFAFGAVNGPIGGPPAFFVTGIGGGFGINRALNVPDDFATFDEYPLIKALDPAASPSTDILGELETLRDTFPIEQGQLWFAAGISFTSFALVDGVAVVGVEIGDGLDINLFGLARMALPRPSVALVSIELGLLARFSSSEGVLWVQAQLTDNSWLFHESVRLTGGFAFVAWFSGPRAGQFVLTIGGYHPSFNADGLPVVPRLGFNWQVASNIVIKGESYFALTSEAIMAGGALEASATFGPAWASVVFKADGIVYFDPFSFSIEVSAKISAGVKVFVLFGTINIKVSLGARILVEGPDFRGEASFEVGPVSLTVRFGDSSDGATPVLSWAEFVPKYLEEAGPGIARLVTALPGKGALPSGPTGDEITDTATADGSASRPYEVVPEFSVTLTTLAPVTSLNVGGTDVAVDAPVVSLAPMNISDTDADLTITFKRDGTGADEASEFPSRQVLTGVFPWGVWGSIPDQTNRTVPKDRTITAPNGVVLDATVTIEGTIDAEISANRVETSLDGLNLALPFLVAAADRPTFVDLAADRLGATVDVSADALKAADLAGQWLSVSGRSLTGIAALPNDRVAPPTVGSLTEDLAIDLSVVIPVPVVEPPVVAGSEESTAPTITALLSNTAKAIETRVLTSVSNKDLPRIEAPMLVGATAASTPTREVFVNPTVSGAQLTLIDDDPVVVLPTSTAAGTRTTVRVGDVFAGSINELQSALSRKGTNGGPALNAGQIALLSLGDETRTEERLATFGAGTRVVMIQPGGEVAFDGAGTNAAIPRSAAAAAVINTGAAAGSAASFAGWHVGQELPYLGWNTLIAGDSVLRSERITTAKIEQGWQQVAAVVDRSGPVTTTFNGSAQSLVVVLDRQGGSLGQGTPDLGLALTGAKRRNSRGQPVDPLAIVSKSRTVLVYELTADAGFSATVDAVGSWQLSATAATASSPETVVALLERQAIETLITTLAPTGTRQSRLRWQASNGAS